MVRTVDLAGRTDPDPGDYSEQQMVDCAWGKNGANGCDPSQYDAYLKYAEANSNSGIAAEVCKNPRKQDLTACFRSPTLTRTLLRGVPTRQPTREEPR